MSGDQQDRFPLRSTFGKDISEFKKNWCLGQPLPIPDERAWDALGELESLWPESLKDFLQKGVSGILSVAPLVHIGLLFAACKNLEGFNGVLRRVKTGQHSGLSELTLAAGLIKAGYDPTLEPELNEKMLDARISVDGRPIYFEAVAPERSDEFVEVIKGATLLAEGLVKQIGFKSLELNMACEPADVSTGTQQEIVGLVHSGDTLEKEISDKIFLRSGPFNPVITITPFHWKLDAPILGTNRSIVSNAGGSAVTVRFPFGDNRAQRLMEAETHHFSRDEINSLVMDLSRVQSGFDWWEPLIKRRFQPNINTRFGGVIFFREGFFVHDANMMNDWHVLPNPHAIHKLPEELMGRIAGLNKQSLF
jgi:hypothetical protein